MDSSLILAVKKTTKANNKKSNSDRTHIFFCYQGKGEKYPFATGYKHSSNGIFLKGRRYFTIAMK
jgi:hypothetical protein